MMAQNDSPHGRGYKTWSTNAGKAGSPRYYSYTFNEIQNPDAFLEGEWHLWIHLDMQWC